MKKILVVDDEADIRKLLKESLEIEGYLVFTAANGAEAIQKIVNSPDLILLDINMPDIDGYKVCEQVRNYVNCPILFLTARTEEPDRINGLKAGGDDYILKPFSINELLARIEAHLRREERKHSKSNIYISGDLAVNFSNCEVLYEGENVDLTRTEYLIVELLLTNRGQVLGKEQIYEKVRGFDREADASIIAEHVRRIRGKLDSRNAKKYIETVWGVGYKWIG